MISPNSALYLYSPIDLINSSVAFLINSGLLIKSIAVNAIVLLATNIPLVPISVPPDATACQLCAAVPGTHVAARNPTVGLRAATWVPGTPAHSWQAVSSGGTEIGTKGMLVASKTMALTAIDLMSNPELIKKATEEFNKSIGEYKYKALLGDIKPALNYRD